MADLKIHMLTLNPETKNKILVVATFKIHMNPEATSTYALEKVSSTCVSLILCQLIYTFLTLNSEATFMQVAHAKVRLMVKVVPEGQQEVQ